MDGIIYKQDNQCVVSLETSNHSRRCFMTGEYCSQQRNVQQQRKKMHDNKKIMAFVVMNFSDMSEVVYKWRICSYIEKLAKYFFISKDKKQLYCSALHDEEIDKDVWEPVKEIEVVRADTDPSSNYVICNRICQQMQMADLVVVDVSRHNPNVFYEFGMAVALEKLILPICYSESYFNMSIPEGLKNSKEYKDYNENARELEHHIGCYPWRKSLFEYYGICYKEADSAGNNQDKTEYKEFQNVKKAEYGFSDKQYGQFPYHEKINLHEDKVIGEEIYNKLRRTYNEAKPINNTLVVYTMDKFLNEEQSGRCIVNFYHRIIRRFRDEECFCGERVGVLVQGNYIPEDDKDAKKQSNLLYGIGEIIQIGLNQATYHATERKIKTHDVLDISGVKLPGNKSEKDGRIKKYNDDIIRCVKEYIRNRGLLVYPNNPIFVNRLMNKFYKSLFDKENNNEFYLYYAMLKTLCYTNEIVVDISHNFEKCLQTLFWLGAAHGSDIYAITVLHQVTDEERKTMNDSLEKKARNIFDVAGLWTAILCSNDIEGFYKQLSLAQQGVENHSKLVLADRKFYEKEIKEPYSLTELDKFQEVTEKLYTDKKIEEKHALESYYRSRFWNAMLRYNQLYIYLPQGAGIDKAREPKAYMVRWDFDAVSELSFYLSKRKPIGEYRIIAFEKKEENESEEEYLKRVEEQVIEAKEGNFISVGKDATPLGKQMADYINEFSLEQYASENNIHTHVRKDIHRLCKYKSSDTDRVYRVYQGFSCTDGGKKGFFTQHPGVACATCDKASTGKENIYKNISSLGKSKCVIGGNKEHTEITQLLLWRDEKGNTDKESRFRVSLIGSSGPATLAATLLFVDEEQKLRYLESRKYKNDREGEEEKEEFLVELQEIVRKEFMKVFMQRLMSKVRQEPLDGAGMNTPTGERKKEYYFYLVECAVTAYLSTVLYRYFLPFLSERDIKRIRNGMCAFLEHMKTTGESPFALGYYDEITKDETVASDANVENIIRIIPEELVKVLNAFKGLEAFYMVKVQHGEDANEEKDTRSVKNMEMFSINGEERVKCYFVFEDEEDA